MRVVVCCLRARALFYNRRTPARSPFDNIKVTLVNDLSSVQRDEPRLLSKETYYFAERPLRFLQVHVYQNPEEADGSAQLYLPH